MQEAIRLFKVSTMEAASQGELMLEGVVSDDVQNEVQRAEQMIKRQVAFQAKVSERALVEDLVNRMNFSEFTVRRALQVLVGRGDFEYKSGRMFIKRVRA